jgi:hypothetical protein
MNARTYVGNVYDREKRPTIHIPRIARPAVGYQGRAITHVHTKEVVVIPTNSKIDALEKKTMDISSGLSSRLEEMKKMDERITSSISRAESDNQSLRAQLQLKEEQLKSLRAELEEKQRSIDILHDHTASTSVSVLSLVEEINDTKIDLHAKVEEKEKDISSLNDRVDGIDHCVSLIKSRTDELEKKGEKSNPETLMIGKDVNLPRQPESISEMGVWKTAPLTLSVNGGIVFHDIGYTTNGQGTFPLVWDPSTSRVLVGTLDN